MGTLGTKLDKVRLHIKDTDKTKFTDAQLVILAEDVRSRIDRLLESMESNLIFTQATFDTVVGTTDYTLATLKGLADETVWISDPEYPLTLVTQLPTDGATGSPTRYALLPDGNISLYPEPNTIETISYGYYAESTPFTDYVTDDIPYFGMWDEALERIVTLEALEILERDVSRVSILANDAWMAAIQKTVLRGCRRRQSKGSYVTSRLYK